MVGHISYLSEKGMQEKFGRKLQEKADYEFSFDADFQVESYLRHQGFKFVERFDANSVLYITRAMDYFDLSKQFKGGLTEALDLQSQAEDMGFRTMVGCMSSTSLGIAPAFLIAQRAQIVDLDALNNFQPESQHQN